MTIYVKSSQSWGHSKEWTNEISIFYANEGRLDATCNKQRNQLADRFEMNAAAVQGPTEPWLLLAEVEMDSRGRMGKKKQLSSAVFTCQAKQAELYP